LEMIRAYFETDPTQAQMGRMAIYKAMCDLLWTLWGLIQHTDNNRGSVALKMTRSLI
jgi:thiamine kinase-like enzyme